MLINTRPPPPPAKGQNNGLFKDKFSMQPNTITVTNTKSPVACCYLKAGDHEAGSSSESRTSSSSEGEEDAEEQKSSVKEDDKEGNAERGGGSLVMVDGEEELELETLLRASACILGASGANIVYKAVLQDGTTFVVRRIGESVAERMKDFENQVRRISKLRHPNLVRVRGFYWGMMRSLSSTTISPMAVLLPSLTVKKLTGQSHSRGIQSEMDNSGDAPCNGVTQSQLEPAMLDHNQQEKHMNNSNNTKHQPTFQD
ncbi:hypothetical protein Ancab_028294 [Ancistrocladus abbreviatus]